MKTKNLKQVDIKEVKQKIRTALEERGYTVHSFCSDKAAMKEAGLQEYKNASAYLYDSGPCSFVFLTLLYRYLGLGVLRNKVKRIVITEYYEETIAEG